MIYRGSRKHFLDWTEDPRFTKDLTTLLSSTDTSICLSDHWMPRGFMAPRELKLSHAEANLILPKVRQRITNWWLIHREGANTPNWDLVCTCSINGTKGLVLVEGKAHESELNREVKGKYIEENATLASLDNHKQIGQCIEEVRGHLNKMGSGVNISRDTHYQLSNRVTFAWKLASEGVPVVLMYLGFIGDTYFKNDYLRDKAHWQKVFLNHSKNILPDNFINKPIFCGGATMTILIRSIQVKDVSI